MSTCLIIRPGCESEVVSVLRISVLALACLLLPGSRAVASAAASNTVDVTLSEYKIEMPATLAAGPTTFKVTNSGSKTHNFKIEGSGLEEKLKSNLKKGESGTVEVNLKPGTYKITCPVWDHDHKGMTLDLTVK